MALFKETSIAYIKAKKTTLDFVALSGSKTSNFQGLHSLIDYYFFVMYLLTKIKPFEAAE